MKKLNLKKFYFLLALFGLFATGAQAKTSVSWGKIFKPSKPLIKFDKHLYFSQSPSGLVRDFNLSTHHLFTTPTPYNRVTIVGLAYEPKKDTYFLRIAPGAKVAVVKRLSGAVVKTFALQKMPGKCGKGRKIHCGLTLRHRDGHLFADHPNGRYIMVYDQNGNLLDIIKLHKPKGPINAVAYHQKKDLLFLLNKNINRVTIVNLFGHDLHSFNVPAALQNQAMALDSSKSFVFIPAIPSNTFHVFDTNGVFKGAVHPPVWGGSLVGGADLSLRKRF